MTANLPFGSKFRQIAIGKHRLDYLLLTELLKQAPSQTRVFTREKDRLAWEWRRSFTDLAQGRDDSREVI
jgi:hypothetical protein